jgi:hypothetical protein
MLAHYYANVTMIDEKIGEILLALKQRGAWTIPLSFLPRITGIAWGNTATSRNGSCTTALPICL